MWPEDNSAEKPELSLQREFVRDAVMRDDLTVAKVFDRDLRNVECLAGAGTAQELAAMSPAGARAYGNGSVRCYDILDRVMKVGKCRAHGPYDYCNAVATPRQLGPTWRVVDVFRMEQLANELDAAFIEQQIVVALDNRGLCHASSPP
jgi:hypothetical protein